MSEDKGYEVKCHDSRCSIVCLNNWAARERRIIDFFLEAFMPRSCTAYRGNLTLPKHADPAAHRKARSSFLRALKRRCPGLALRAYLHVTNPRDAHYDFIAYAPDDVDVDVATIVKAAWAVAGGRRATCRPLHGEDDQTAWAAYMPKGRDRDNRRWRYVPVRGGLRLTFQTDEFFGPGRSADDVHAAWVAATFPTKMKAELARMLHELFRTPRRAGG